MCKGAEDQGLPPAHARPHAVVDVPLLLTVVRRWVIPAVVAGCVVAGAAIFFGSKNVGDNGQPRAAAAAAAAAGGHRAVR